MPFCFQPMPEPGNREACVKKNRKISYLNLEVLIRLRCEKVFLAEPLFKICIVVLFFSLSGILFIWHPSFLLEIKTDVFNSNSFKYHYLLQRHTRNCPQRPLMYTKKSCGLQLCIRLFPFTLRLSEAIVALFYLWLLRTCRVFEGKEVNIYSKKGCGCYSSRNTRHP